MGDLDVNFDGKVTKDEWADFTKSKEAKAALTLIGLDSSKTEELFNLIDLDSNGELGLEEFVVGSMQLSGSAKMVDVETLLRNNKKLLVKVGARFDQMMQYQHRTHVQTCDLFTRLEAAILTIPVGV